MSIDACALLRIKKLLQPKTPLGVELPVAHWGDASVVSLLTSFRGQEPDEHALALRKLLGAALDRHDDPRGILFFPDVCEFRGKSYEAIVAEVEGAGVWAPNVRLDHVPARYVNAAPGTHGELVGRMIEHMGRDAALEFDMLAQTYALLRVAGVPDAEEVEHLDTLAHAIDFDFAAEYAKSVERKVREEADARQSQLERTSEALTRAERGEPLVTGAELNAFVESGGADAVLVGLEPSLREALEKQLGALGVDALPDGDLGKALATALKRTKG